MKLKVYSPPEKISTELIERATKFYVNALMKPRISNTLDVKVKFAQWHAIEGLCDCDLDEEYPKEFEITLNASISRYRMLKVLAHEVTHMWQYRTGRLRDLDRPIGVTRFNKKRYKLDENKLVDYYMSPWEIEAQGYEISLYILFQQDLYNDKKHHRKRSGNT